MNQKSSSSLIHIRNNFNTPLENPIRIEQKTYPFSSLDLFKTSSQISEANFINIFRSVTFSTLPPKIREIQRDRKVELVASACIFQRSLFPLGAYVRSSQEWWWWTKGCTVEEAVGRYRRRHPL